MPTMNDDANDGEMIDIFVEEAAEVLENIDRHLAVWRLRPADKNALAEIRRGFHTLKGSGRMVKALNLGELAWKVENLLNRAMEGALPVTEPMVKLVASCRGVMPRLVEAFKSQRELEIDGELDALMGQADAIANGQMPAAAPPRAAPAAASEPGIQTKLNELNRKFERSAQRADEALQRSEMALREVRRVAEQLKSLGAEAQERVGHLELNPLIERVNLLSAELADLRFASRKGQQEAASHPRDLQQLIDHRVRERLAATERFKSEVERQVEENRRAAASARSLGMWALFLALLLAGSAIAVALRFFVA